jgi:hypothetical protein
MGNVPGNTLATIDPDKVRQLQLLSSGLAPSTPPPSGAGTTAGMHPLAKIAATPSAAAAPVLEGGPQIAPPIAPTTPSLPGLNFKQRQALPMTSPGVEAGSLESNQNKLARLQDQQKNPLGSAENQPGTLGKIGHVLGKIGNVAGDILDPKLTARIPGSDLNRQGQENKLQSEIDTQQGERTKERHEQNVEDTNEQKLDQAEQKIEETSNKDKSARQISLRKQGLEEDKDGNVIPLSREKMSDTETAVLDLKAAQTDSATAKAALDQIRADPNSPQNKAALARIQVSAKNAATAAGKLGLDKEKFVADYFGLDKNGNPIAGTQKDEATGQPIGPRIANANNPSADRLKRGDLGENVQINTKELRGIIAQHPDLLGPLAGRFTNAEQMIGNNDPYISRIGTAVHNIALASNGAHGVRSADAVHATEHQILNDFHNGPDAVNGSLDELDKSVQSFIDDAKRGKRPSPSPNEPAKGGGGFKAPEGAPNAPKEDGKVLKVDGKAVAVSKGGQWQAPQ